MLRFLQEAKAASLVADGDPTLQQQQVAVEPYAKRRGLGQSLPLYTKSYAPRGRIVAVSIALFSPEHVIRIAVCEVTEQTLFDKNGPKLHSLYCPQMGPCDKEFKCSTCGGTLDDCAGHMAYISFCHPIYHPCYMHNAATILQCVCHSCSRFLLNDDHPRVSKIVKQTSDIKKRLTLLSKLSEAVDKCPGCRAHQRTYMKNKLNIHCFLRRKKPERAPKKTKKATKGRPKKGEKQEDGDDDDEKKSALSGELLIDEMMLDGTLLDAAELDDGSVSVSGHSSVSSVSTGGGSLVGLSGSVSGLLVGAGIEDDEESKVAVRAKFPGQDDPMLMGGDEDEEEDEDESGRRGGLHRRDGDDDTASRVAKKGGAASGGGLGGLLDDDDLDMVDFDDLKGPNEDADDADEAAREKLNTANLRAKMNATSRKRAGAKVEFTVADALNILKRIDEKDYEKFGFQVGLTRPQYMILTVLPVPPLTARLPNLGPQGRKSRGENDMTRHLKRILSYSNKVKALQEIIDNPMNKPADRKRAGKEIKSCQEKLQKNVAAYFDKDIPGAAQVTGHGKGSLNDVMSRFNKKSGRLRGNMNAKRINFCARSVIDPDTTSDPDWLGVPVEICMKLTWPVKVTPYNILECRKYVLRGPDVYPGAKNVITSDGELIDLRFARTERVINLLYGWTVERHLLPGDVGLFGRQPSLHKMSLMAYYIYPIQARVFRLSLLVMKVYNADADGDEMNLIVPQTLEARAEALMLLPSKQINSPQDTACIGLAQDGLVGARMATNKDVFLTEDEMQQMAAQLKYWKRWELPPPAVTVRNRKTGEWHKLWTGKQLVSLTFPRARISGQDTRLHCLNNVHKWDNSVLWNDGTTEGDPQQVCVSGGDLLVGLLGKESVGPSRGSLIQVSQNDFGWQATMQFIADLHRECNYYLSENGCGLGPSDVVNTPEAQKKIDELRHRSVTWLKSWNSDKYSEAVREEHTKTLLARTRDQAGKIATKVARGTSTRMQTAILSGAKGSLVNISQTKATTGSTLVNNQRIDTPYGAGRSLPHFEQYSKDPAARGHIAESYIEGMTPTGTYFQGMGGREGLVDTATKTADVGYLIRRLMKAMEDLRVCYDQTVRNHAQDIISFVYGQDGFDPSSVERQEHPCVDKDGQTVINMYDARQRLKQIYGGNEQSSQEDEGLFRDEITQILRDVVFLRQAKLARKPEKLNNSVKYPIPFARIVDTAQYQSNERRSRNLKLPLAKPRDVLEMTKTLTAQMEKLVRAPESLRGVLSLMRVHLSVVNLLAHHQIDELALAFIREEVLVRFMNAQVPAGEMVGGNAGQSLGEPAQQLTLNTFHLSGLGSNRAMTNLISRMDELIRVAKKPKSTGLILHLPRDKQNRDYANKLIQQIRPMKLGKFIADYNVFFDPSPVESRLPNAFDRELVASHVALRDDRELRNLSVMVLHFVVSRAKCIAYGHTIDDVFEAMTQAFPSNHLWAKSPVNASRWVIILRLRNNTKEYRKYMGYAQKRADLDKAAERSVAETAAIAEAASLAATASTPVMPSESLSSKSTSSKSSTVLPPTVPLPAKSSKKFTPTPDSDIYVSRQAMNFILKLPFHGIDGVLNVFLQKTSRVETDEKTMAAKTHDDQLLIETRGSNLRAALNVAGVDFTRVTCTNPYEAQAIIGVEGASEILRQQLEQVFENGAYVNEHHPDTLIDTMNSKGRLVGMSRNGFYQDKQLGFLKRCSFERLVRVLVDAGLGEIDPLNTVTSNVIVGREPPIGGQLCHVYMDNPTNEAMKQDLAPTLDRNDQELTHRMMDEIDARDLIRLVPPCYRRPKTRKNVSAIAAGSENYHEQKFTQSITAKNSTLVLPDFGTLVRQQQEAKRALRQAGEAANNNKKRAKPGYTTAKDVAERQVAAVKAGYVYRYPTWSMLNVKSVDSNASKSKAASSTTTLPAWRSLLQEKPNNHQLQSSKLNLPLGTTYTWVSVMAK